MTGKPVLKVSYRPLTPVFFGGPGETDPGIVYARSKSEPVPSPSTIAGAIMSTINPTPDEHLGGWGDLLDSYVKRLDDAGIEDIRAPLLHIQDDTNGKTHVIPVYTCGKTPIYTTIEAALKTADKVASHECTVKPRQCDIAGGQVVLSHKQLVTTHVHLKTREHDPSKTAKEEMLYTLTRTVYQGKVEITAELHLSTPAKATELLDRFKGIARIAGKNTLAQNHATTATAEQMNGDTIILLAPLPLPEDTSPAVLRGRVYGIIEDKGLGYSLALKERKPHAKMLMPGTIIPLDKPVETRGTGRELIDILQEKLPLPAPQDDERKALEILARLGYGTHILYTRER